MINTLNSSGKEIDHQSLEPDKIVFKYFNAQYTLLYRKFARVTLNVEIVQV